MVACCYPTTTYILFCIFDDALLKTRTPPGPLFKSSTPHPLFFQPPVRCRLIQPDPPSMVPCIILVISVLYTPPMPFTDPEKRREASRRHYAKHRQRVIDKAKEYSRATRSRIRAFINTYLKANPCVDCGETNIIVLEFDHIGNDKHFSISDVTRLGYGMPKLKAEIAKCEVRCANCHRKKTYERGGWTHKG
jgi:hypothetical protein